MEVKECRSAHMLCQLKVESKLLQEIFEAQQQDEQLKSILKSIESKENADFRVRNDGVICFDDRVVVPKNWVLREKILKEAHHGYFNLHPGSTKMYHNLKRNFWWHGIRNDVSKYVSKCLICQQVKVEHQKPAGLLQPLDIPQWKWEIVSMDFVLGLPLTFRKK